MIEIIPNWHPLVVHFTVALTISALVFSVGALLLARGSADHSLAAAARWTLWLGAGVTVLTVLAGLSAYGTVNHDTPSHVAMTDHRNWAIPSAAVLWLTALWVFLRSRKGGGMDISQVALILLSTVAISVTGLKGGELVFRHGLGVMSLPAVSGEGHDHDHGDGADGHGHDDDMMTEEDGHDHAEDSGDHEHAEGSGDHDHGGTGAVATKEDPATVADAFNDALKAGDADEVSRVLAENVLILEGGHAEHSRQEYMSGHMLSDMAFLKDMDREIVDREVGVSGDIAWVTTHARMHGQYKGDEIDFASREFLFLRHGESGWKVELVHWSDK